MTDQPTTLAALVAGLRVKESQRNEVNRWIEAQVYKEIITRLEKIVEGMCDVALEDCVNENGDCQTHKYWWEQRYGKFKGNQDAK